MGLCNSHKNTHNNIETNLQKNIIKNNEFIILSIEDDIFHYKLLEFVLSENLNFKYKLLWTDNGIDGYEMIKNENPNIVILDRMLNGINGDEVIMKLSKNKINYNFNNIIISSNKTKLSDYINIENLGVITYIPKPINIKLLILTINMIFNRQK